MQLPEYNRHQVTGLLQVVFFAALAALLALLPAATSAQTAPETAGGQKIHITAERLVSDQNRQYAEFTGDVRATQGETLIESDRLKVFYKGGADLSGEQAAGEVIKKIVATGHVTIDFEDKTAYSEKAVYTAQNGELVLSGPDTRIESKSNYIHGEKIVWNRNTGEITVIGGTDKRVEAVFESEEENPGDVSPEQTPDGGQ